MERASTLNPLDNSFSKFGKSFQEKLAFLILDDRVFADRMAEVLNIEFLELKYLQVFVDRIFSYKKKYGTHPSFDTMQTILKSGLDAENDAVQKQVRDFYTRCNSDVANIVEAAEYVKETSLDFCRKQKLHEAMVKSVGLIKRSSFDEIANVINNALKMGADADFGYDYLKDFEERYAEKSRPTISTGWHEFDKITHGGHGKAELGVIIAPTGGGKSHVLVHLGATALKMGMNVVYYTCELADTVVAQRFDSCITGVELDDLKEKKDDVFESIKDIEGELIVKSYPTKSATTNTIRAHLEKLKQQNFIPDLILVDYADLLRSLSTRKEKRDELESVYEELRAIAQEANAAVWTASQTNRSGIDAEVVTMNSISEAFSKCFVADFIFTLSRTMDDRANNQGRFYVAKNRNGPDGMVYSIFMDTANVNIKITGNYTPQGQGQVLPMLSDEDALKKVKEKYKKFKNGGN